jgi:hypothetical protein
MRNTKYKKGAAKVQLIVATALKVFGGVLLVRICFAAF